MSSERDRALLDLWRNEEQMPFSGWDFSHLEGRMFSELPPWDYMHLAAQRMQKATSVLDMDTGGGERLLELRRYWPASVTVTESYPPNLRLITERLAPLGVRVVDTELSDDSLMPFSNGEFDLVLNRHGGLNPSEVARILAPGGIFLTQQVHALSGQDLMQTFGATPQFPDATPENYVPKLQASGMKIITLQEWSGKSTFADVAALVYYLKAIPWMVPGFSVDRFADTLLHLHEQQMRGQPLVFSERRYLIVAQKQ